MKLLGVWLLSLALASCMPGRERFKEREEPEPPRTHRIDLETSDGETIALFRVRRRSATISDGRGVRIGRASVVQDRIVVRDRLGRVHVVLSPEPDPVEAGGENHSARLEDAEGNVIGRLTVTDRQVRLFGAEGFQRGETTISTSDFDQVENDEVENDEVEAAVYGAEGTDVLTRVRSTAPREVTTFTPSDEPVARFTGYPIPVWIAAALTLEEPDLPNPDPENERLFQIGALLYLWRL